MARNIAQVQRELLRVFGIVGRRFPAHLAFLPGRSVRKRECKERHA